MSPAGNRYRVCLRQDLRPAPLSGKRLKEMILGALPFLPVSGADLRVRVVGDGAIARWNREFLGRDRPTNVLSFPDGDIAPSPGGEISGDIVVSAQTCLAQTEAWEETPEERVFYFILHGMLHLAGYEHVSGGAEARVMRRKELLLFRRILSGSPKGNRP